MLEGEFKKNIQVTVNLPSLRESCPYSEFFWSLFYRIRTEYGEIRSISLYSVRMRENTDQENSKNGYFLGSGYLGYNSGKRNILTNTY